MDGKATERFVSGSRTLLNALLLRGDTVPDEMQRVQELVECVDNNAQKIAAALAANRRRGASATGADTTAQLLKEQKQFISQIVELYEQLSNKPALAEQATE
ncbi:hypothetical protein PRIC1_013469 [Phytophthora ramorum]|uniref:uncharacterized protein n=1 Tax=Phytophthora ramorum TaxID=164328 RepID=UPI0030989C84|nr:hypothetical protein KRP23_8537 [Phytophthora ramorum]KAH7500595.1 hypothetical protein KRP22_9843 [Phytophthora ramorum]